MSTPSAQLVLTGGWITTSLIDSKGWGAVKAYRIVFLMYAAIGMMKLILALSLSKHCEAEKQSPPPDSAETAPLLGNSTPKPDKTPSRFRLLPQISRESRFILIQLCLFFAFDSFASGLAPLYVALSFLQPLCKRANNLKDHGRPTISVDVFTSPKAKWALSSPSVASSLPSPSSLRPHSRSALATSRLWSSLTFRPPFV